MARVGSACVYSVQRSSGRHRLAVNSEGVTARQAYTGPPDQVQQPRTKEQSHSDKRKQMEMIRMMISSLLI